MPATASKRMQTPKPVTPWISTTHPVTELQYKFRIERHRNGGATHINFAKDSPTLPGKSYVVRNQRSGFFPFYEAAAALLQIARVERNAVSGPTMWRWYWEPQCMEYPNRAKHFATITTYLDVIANPRAGAPVSERVTDAAAALRRGEGGVRTGYAVSRANRRQEILTASAAMRATLDPVLERCSGGKAMMGYTLDERRQIMQLLAEVQHAVHMLRDMVFNNKFAVGVVNPVDVPDTATRTHRRTPRVSIGDDDTPISFEDLMGMGAAKPERRTPVLTAEDRANWIANFPDLPIPGDTP